MSQRPTARSGDRPLFTRRFVLALAAQTVFGFAWSLYLIQPKLLARVLGATAGEIGAVSSTSGFAAALAVPFVAATIDRTGRRRLFALGSTLVGLVSLGYFHVDRMGPLVFVLHAGIGASFVMAFNATAALAADAAPPERLGQAFGVQGAANLSMNGVASLVAEHLADAHGWRWVFGLAALASAAAVAITFVLSEDPPSSRAAPGEIHRAPYGPFAGVLLVSALSGAAFNAMFVFHQPYAVALGARKVGAFFVGFTAAALCMRLGFGSLGDRFGRRRIALASLTLYTLVPLLMARLDVGRLWAYGAGLGAAHGVYYPTLSAYTTERAAPAVRGRMLAVLNGAFNAGGALGSTLWGAVAGSAGYPWVFVGAAGVAALALATLATAREPSLEAAVVK